MCVVALSVVADDPRVVRQCRALAEVGVKVHVLGYEGGLSPPPARRIQTVAKPEPTISWRTANLLRLALGRLAPVMSVPLYWTARDRRQLFALARGIDADIYIANDWNTLPLVARLAGATGASFIYDSHEYAIGEFAERFRWRLIYPPTIRAIERTYIRQAADVSTVSASIACLLQKEYGLAKPPRLVRNLPLYEVLPFRPPNETLSVLFHGALGPHRGLEAMIESVPLWRPEFRLIIRGMGDPAYVAFLREKVKAIGVSDRVQLVPPVPADRLVREANAADIGIHCLPGISEENRAALPNKIFEYIMAGLALCVTDLPEMSAVVREFDLGRLIDEATPGAIAEAINGFDRDQVARFKFRALESARELNWGKEQTTLLEMCHVALESRS